MHSFLHASTLNVNVIRFYQRPDHNLHKLKHEISSQGASSFIEEVSNGESWPPSNFLRASRGCSHERSWSWSRKPEPRRSCVREIDNARLISNRGHATSRTSFTVAWSVQIRSKNSVVVRDCPAKKLKSGSSRGRCIPIDNAANEERFSRISMLHVN